MIQFKETTKLSTGEVIGYYRLFVPMPGEGVSYDGELLIKCSEAPEIPGKPYTVSTGLSEIHGATPEEAIARLAKWARRLADELEKARVAPPALPLFNEQ